MAARRAHNPEVAGSSPAPATLDKKRLHRSLFVLTIWYGKRLPLCIGSCADARRLADTFIHRYIRKRFAQNAIMDGP